jgi:primosomal protein N' (replication factor Y)
VILQTFLPDDPSIRAAMKQDYVGFARRELAHRGEVNLPPFARMVRIVLREQEAAKLNRLCEQVAAAVIEQVEACGVGVGSGDGVEVTVKGPMPCAISRIAGYFRNQIVLSSVSAESLQKVLAGVRSDGILTKSDRVAVDVDPVSLL